MIVSVVIMSSACGGEESGSTSVDTGVSARSTTTAGVGTDTTRSLEQLPDVGAVPPGSYYTGEFEPAFSVRIGEQGWVVRGAKSSGRLGLVRGGSESGITFVDVRQVRDPGEPDNDKVVPAPDDLVAWFQNHPYLETGEPESVSIGGASGKQFDAVVSSLPDSGFKGCSDVCLPLLRISEEGQFKRVNLLQGEKSRIAVLDDVNGEKVAIIVFAPEEKFDDFLPKAKEVLDTVRWRA